MYPQFSDGQPSRGMADIRARQPFPGYYTNKLPEGPGYGGMVAPPRHPLPYPGKPEAMVAHDGMYAAGWNPSLPVQGYGGKPGLGKPDYPYMTQQPDMYGRPSAHGYPDPHTMAAYQGGVPPGYSHPQQFSSSYPYGSPMHPMMVDRGGRVVDGYGDGMAHPGSQSGSPGMGAYPMNDPWRRSANRVWRSDAPPQAPPPAPDGYTPNAAPPMPSSGPSTLSTPVAHFPNQTGNMAGALSPQPLTPSSSNELQKHSSVSSIKEALLAGTQGTHAQPPASLSPSVNDGNQSLSAQQSMNQRSSGFPYNNPRMPDLRDSLGQGSPLTPQPALPRTPDPSTPRAVGVSSPALPPAMVIDRQDSSDGDNSQPTRTNDQRPFAKSPLGSFPQTDSNPPSARGIEHRKDMNLLDAHLMRHNSLKSPSGSSIAASPSCDGVHHQENNEGGTSAVQGSREGSPLSPRRTGKGRSPVMSPVERTHSSLVNQYSLSNEPGRKEFLDALFNHLEREGIPLLRLPTVCKAQLDMYKIFTAVQRLGGFCHVVEKRLWKDVLRSFNPSATNPSSASLRTVQEYYVKMLLPYECVISNTNIRDCLVQYETSRRVSTESAPSPSTHSSSGKDHPEQTDQFRAQTDRVNCNTTPGLGKRGEEAGLTDQNGLLGRFPNSQEKPTSQLTALLDHGTRPASGDGGMLGRHQDGLIGFSEDSQGSLDSMTSSQPLPDISVQDAESVLGIPTSNAGLTAATPSAQSASSPSYPSYQGQGGREWPPDYTPNIELPPGAPEMMIGRPSYPSAHPIDVPGYPPYHPYSHRPEFPDYRQSMMYRPYPSMMGVPPGHMPMHEYNNPYQGGGMMGMMRPRMDGSGEMGYPPGASPHGPSASDWHWYQQQQQQQRLRMAGQHPLQRMMYQQQQQHHLPPASSSPRPMHQSFNPQIEYIHQQRARNAEALRSQWEEQRAMKLAAAAAAAKPDMRELKQEKPDAEGRVPAPGTEGAAGIKRPTSEWTGCVEGTKPQLVKRRRLTCDHCGHVEPWRVMMCLKSGLPADSTWALDTLNILLHDDRTVGFFYLKHHHSLLNTLVDHFQVCLSRIFGHNLFKTLPRYMNGMDGSEHVDPGEENTSESISSEVMSELLSTTDYTIMSEPKNGTKSGDKCQRCRQLPPMASVYERTEQDVRLGRRDDISHVLTSCTLFDNGLNDKLPPDHPMETTERKTRGLSQKVQRVDETPINVLTSRDVFTERMLIDLRTPKRLMARSPIQKYFMSLPTPTRAHDQPHHDLFKFESKDGASQPESNTTPLSPKDDRLQEENEVFRKESLPLWSTSAEREFLQRRCLCICNILRSLSFIPGNDYEFSQHSGVLLILGSLLMLHHTHLLRDERRRPMTVYQDEGSLDDAPPPSIQEEFWWWDCLEILRENTLVILANVAGQLDLSIFPEAISYPIVCGLLHWLVCPSTQATDPLPDSAVVFYLSPQRLVVETLAKISISEVNVDYILATPPLTRLDMVYAQVVEFIGHKRHPAVRQFALVLLSNLAQGGEAASRMVGQQKMVIPLLVECLEVSEQAVITSRGKLLGGYNPDDPNSLSVAMLRRAAITLHCLAKVPINRVSFLPHRDRLLHVALSEFLDPSVTSILSDVLFELGKL